jgi:hypothetical protein
MDYFRVCLTQLHGVKISRAVNFAWLPVGLISCGTLPVWDMRIVNLKKRSEIRQRAMVRESLYNYEQVAIGFENSVRVSSELYKRF